MPSLVLPAAAQGATRLRHDRQLLCAGICTAILVIILTSGLALAYLRQQAEGRVAATTQNLAKSMVLTIDGIADSIDLALLASADELARQDGAAPGSHSFKRFLFAQRARLPVAPGISLEEGAAWPGSGLQIAAPALAADGRTWVWRFARRLDSGGALVAALDVEQIEGVLAKINLGSGGSIVLRHAGFEAIAARMGDAAAPRLRPGATALSPELQAALRRDGVRGTYSTSASALSGSAHTFSYERSAAYGFYVWVGEANRVAMAEWVRQVWLIGALTAAFTALSVGLLLLMGRAWRRQARDLHAIEQSHQALREAEQIAAIGNLCYDVGRASWTSSAVFDEIAGISAATPRSLPQLMGLLGRRERVTVQRDVQAALFGGQPFESEQMAIRRLDGQRRWVHARGRASVDAAGRTVLVCTVQDITARKQAQDEIRRLAYYDVLTDLPNRRLLQERLRSAMAASASRACHGALLLIDLDHFKVLNDTHGHARGDLLLQSVALRLKGCMRAGDTVARLGGDEFVVLAGDLCGEADGARGAAAAIGAKLLAVLGDTFDLEGQAYACTPSIGVTLFSGQSLSIDELLQRSDTAMYQAKGAGRNAVRFFDPAMQATMAARVALEADLRLALERQQFALYFQVQVDGEARVRGAEVLLRWQHPQRGMVPPAQFIALAEETGLILPIGHWVLHSACLQLALWADHPATRHLSLAVNVSARQFSQSGFVGQVLAVLAQTGAPAGRLKLELTEGLLLEHTETVIGTIGALKRAGVGISLDDFGTGYSSLSYLKRLPLDQLKIDQTFVRDLLTDVNDAAIVRTIVALGQSLGMEVIAEGVETAAQRDALARAGCHAYQGYLFGKPVPLAQFEDSLHAQLQTGRMIPHGY